MNRSHPAVISYKKQAGEEGGASAGGRAAVHERLFGPRNDRRDTGRPVSDTERLLPREFCAKFRASPWFPRPPLVRSVEFLASLWDGAARGEGPTKFVGSQVGDGVHARHLLYLAVRHCPDLGYPGKEPVSKGPRLLAARARGPEHEPRRVKRRVHPAEELESQQTGDKYNCLYGQGRQKRNHGRGRRAVVASTPIGAARRRRTGNQICHSGPLDPPLLIGDSYALQPRPSLTRHRRALLKLRGTDGAQQLRSCPQAFERNGCGELQIPRPDSPSAKDVGLGGDRRLSRRVRRRADTETAAVKLRVMHLPLFRHISEFLTDSPIVARVSDIDRRSSGSISSPVTCAFVPRAGSGYPAPGTVPYLYRVPGTRRSKN